MSCDHDTLTNLDLSNKEYTLIYCSNFVAADFTKKVMGRHNIESFTTYSALESRVSTLSLTVGLDYSVKFLEQGAVPTQSELDSIISAVWTLDDIELIRRMESLGHSSP